jgi:hypothetical protein
LGLETVKNKALQTVQNLMILDWLHFTMCDANSVKW